jgi:aminomethyltransferase
MSETLLKTPLYSYHLKLGAKMVPFAGYEMPVQYSGILLETQRVRETAGLFDVSHMGQFSLRGKHALEDLQKLVTNDLSRIQMHQAQYNMLCNERGGVIDDLVIYRRSETEVYICVNASNRQVDFDWMKSHLPSSVSLEDQSDDTALIAIQGPNSESILSKIVDAEIAKNLKYYWATDTQLLKSLPCFLSRTGYTGEDGYELYVKASDAGKIWEYLLEIGRSEGLIPVGLGARDTLRTEMGYPLHGHEISQSITPLEAGLNWVVKLEKTTPFIGQEVLRKQAAEGVSKKLRAFIIQDRRLARPGYRIATKTQKLVGEITSGTQSPHVHAPIALGFVESAYAEDELLVQVRESFVPCQTAKLPFVPSHTKRIAPLATT